MEETSFHNDRRGKREDSGPDLGQASSLPKDAQVMVAVLKDMGVTDYEPRVVNQLLEFTYKYVTDVLEDAKTYSNHAGNTNVTKEDVKFAVQMKLDNSFTSPPPREFLVDLAQQKNHAPLPTLKSYTGARLPPDRYCLTSMNYRLKPQIKLQKKNQQRNSLLSSNKGGMASLNSPGMGSQGFRTMVMPGSGASKRKWQDVDDYDT